MRSLIGGLLLLGLNANPQIADNRLHKFMGREVTITGAIYDPAAVTKGPPAAVCLEGPPQRQCYSAPESFVNDPTVTVIHIKKDVPALLFSAATGGVSGLEIHFSLLRPGKGEELEDIFDSDVEVSNQSQHAFWSDLSLSDAPIFLTADYVWGLDESHYEDHRFIISSYILKASWELEGSYYTLQDRYMTVRRYDLENKADVLRSERQEILARLHRLKAAAHPK